MKALGLEPRTYGLKGHLASCKSLLKDNLYGIFGPKTRVATY